MVDQPSSGNGVGAAPSANHEIGPSPERTEFLKAAMGKAMEKPGMAGNEAAQIKEIKHTLALATRNSLHPVTENSTLTSDDLVAYKEVRSRYTNQDQPALNALMQKEGVQDRPTAAALNAEADLAHAAGQPRAEFSLRAQAAVAAGRVGPPPVQPPAPPAPAPVAPAAPLATGLPGIHGYTVEMGADGRLYDTVRGIQPVSAPPPAPTPAAVAQPVQSPVPEPAPAAVVPPPPAVAAPTPAAPVMVASSAHPGVQYAEQAPAPVAAPAKPFNDLRHEHEARPQQAHFQKAEHAPTVQHGHKETETFQKAIKAMGGDFDLGGTGKGKDGVDGDWGPKTQAAFEKVCKAAGVDPKDVNLSQKPANEASAKLAGYMDKQIHEHTRAKAQEHVKMHVHEEKAASTAIERANIPVKVEQEIHAAMGAPLQFSPMAVPDVRSAGAGASQGRG